MILDLTGLLSAEEGERLRKHEKRYQDASFRNQQDDKLIISIEIKEEKTHAWFKLLYIITHLRYFMTSSFLQTAKEGGIDQNNYDTDKRIKSLHPSLTR